jgi:DNA-binding GntR family transcriptional regulator
MQHLTQEGLLISIRNRGLFVIKIMSDADMAFYEHLVALTGSRSPVRIHTTLMIETRMCLTVLQDSYRFTDEWIGEHRVIAEAVRGGDGPLAQTRLNDHEDAVLARQTGAPASVSVDTRRTRS